MLSVKVDRIPILPIGDLVDQGPTLVECHVIAIEETAKNGENEKESDENRRTMIGMKEG